MRRARMWNGVALLKVNSNEIQSKVDSISWTHSTSTPAFE